MSVVFHPLDWSPLENDAVLERYPAECVASSLQLQKARRGAAEKSLNLGVLLDWIYWSCASRVATDDEIKANLLSARLERDILDVFRGPWGDREPPIVDRDTGVVTFRLREAQLDFQLDTESDGFLIPISITHPVHGRFEITWNDEPGQGDDPVLPPECAQRVWDCTQDFMAWSLEDVWVRDNYGSYWSGDFPE